jgi:hypothetical protein
MQDVLAPPLHVMLISSCYKIFVKILFLGGPVGSFVRHG